VPYPYWVLAGNLSISIVNRPQQLAVGVIFIGGHFLENSLGNWPRPGRGKCGCARPIVSRYRRSMQMQQDRAQGCAVSWALKNIQIIDGALNATFSVFQATDDEFAAIFPADAQDIELIEDFIKRCGEDEASRILGSIWQRPILKRDAQGIHGTLYYEYGDRRQYLPATKREVDWNHRALNSAQRQLFASKR
jgi:hypothetical protein